MKKYIIAIVKRIFKVKKRSELMLLLQKPKRKILKLISRKKYGVEDIIEVMKDLGMKRGSIIFIHCSMAQFYNFKGNVEDIICRIIEEIGDEGTLLMPAYPKSVSELVSIAEKNPDEVVFDVKTTPTGAGYMAEVFRKMPNVKRSINLQHSVCAIGKDSDYFISEHHLSETAWDEKSPYYKLYLKEAFIFSFGLPYFLGTTIHCTETILRSKYRYFSMFFQKQILYSYCDSNGLVSKHRILLPGIDRVRDKKKMIKLYFDDKTYHYKHISNLRIEMVNANDMLRIFLEQAEKGVTMYSKPNPAPYIKDGRFIEL